MKKAVRNQLLINARLRIPSPNMPGAAMTRRELTEALNDYISQRDPTALPFDTRSVGVLERGVTRWPRSLTREALRSVLRAKSDAALGLHRGSLTPYEPVSLTVVPKGDVTFPPHILEPCNKPEQIFSANEAQFSLLELTSEFVLVTDRRRVR